MTEHQVKPDPDEDGVTHINVYTRGKTQLGRDLTNLSDIGFDHPRLGSFRCMEGLWYYGLTGYCHDDLRTLNGFDAKRVGRKKIRRRQLDEDQFREDIIAGLEARFEQNPDLKEALVNSHLPLLHYYCYFSKKPGVPPKVIVPSHRWVIDALEAFRERYKKDLL